ncbi:hypothetical protein HYH03_017602 [Edaphochlamys debaryana]|uniref:Protein kinase domain-containing protein n=1 Tax=Edaphochlamys debaryana TaxID=47281 RepID=A0A835XIR8_9CHLO|nr:hypothetical protein HYH03_017602 [Edaphochlamys debaryana]|eukprot:KAG2483548.1 hypothetical protein HYH03_017602 [Edaphochlamys debaryana]
MPFQRRWTPLPLAGLRVLGLLAALVVLYSPLNTLGGEFAGAAQPLSNPAGEASVRTGREFALALADGSVGVIRVLSDVTLSDADWEGLATPVPVARNVTVTGPDPDRWPLLDLALIKAKAQLRGGATLVFRDIALVQFRAKYILVAPGVDLLLPTPAGERASVVVNGSLLLTRFCYPLDVQTQYFGAPQQLVSQEGCTNATSAAPRARCWARRGVWNGSWPGVDEDDGGRRFPNNYDITLNATGFACSAILSKECIDRFTAVGCAVLMLRQQQSSKPPPPEPAAEPEGQAYATPGEPDGGDTGVILGAVLGSVGGVILVGVIVAAAWGVRRRRLSLKSAKSCEGGASGSGSEGAPLQEVPLCKVWVAPTPPVEPLQAGPEQAQEPPENCEGHSRQLVSPMTPPRPDLVTNVALEPAADRCTPPPPGQQQVAGAASSEEVVTLLPTVLGRGAFGCVHLGTFRGARVAVKVLNGDSAWMPTAAARPPPAKAKSILLLTMEGSQDPATAGKYEPQPQPAYAQLDLSCLAAEVEVLGRCNHPNVVRLLAACLAPPRPCLVFELMETNLDRLVYGARDPREKASPQSGDASRQLLPLATVLHIALQIAQALAYLHPSVVHRDLKPANVLISNPDSPTPVVKLTDFGLARLRAETVATLHPEAGTPAYLAPECYDEANQVVTHHADMYSLGVVVWAMLTGRQPWKGLTIPAVAYKVAVLGERPPLDQVSESRCPAALRALITACWEGDPLRRPAASEASRALRSLLAEAIKEESAGLESGSEDLVATHESLRRSPPLLPATAALALGLAIPCQTAGGQHDALGHALRIRAAGDGQTEAWRRLSTPPSFPESALQCGPRGSAGHEACSGGVLAHTVSQGPGSAPSGAAGSAQLPPTATSSATLGEAPVRTGREFALALADGSVGVIRVLSDVTLSDADWEGLATPVPVARNVTVTGPDPERWPLLDMAYVTGKVRLRGGVTLKFADIGVDRFRIKNVLLAPGLDLLAATPADEHASVMMVGGLLLTRICYPLDLQALYFRVPQRPLDQADCVNDTAAPLQRRCWAQRGIWDGGWPGMDEEGDGRRTPNNYSIMLRKAESACYMVMTKECIDRFSAIGCATAMMLAAAAAQQPPPPLAAGPVPGATTPGAPDSEGGGGSGSSTGVVVGAVLGAVGGLLLVCTLAALAIWVAKRRHKEQQRRDGKGGGQDASKHGSGAKPGSSPGGHMEELPLCKVWMPPSSLERPSSSGAMASEHHDSGSGPHQQVVSPLAPPRPDLVTHVALRPAAAASPRAADRAPEDPMAAAADVVTLLPTILGRGAFGCVHLGTFRGARVAVKVLNGDSDWVEDRPPEPPRPAGDQGGGKGVMLSLTLEPRDQADGAKLLPDTRGRMLLSTLAAEVEVLGRCDHPNVVRLLAACLAPPRPCLVFELMETNLDRLVYGDRSKDKQAREPAQSAADESTGSNRAQPLLPLDMVLHIALQIAQALEYLHPSVVHRDLKPANVLISNPDSPTPVVKLTDFGLARLRAETVATLHPEAGTPAYLAPECYDTRNVVVTHHADMYSLGVVVWAMLTGRQPWKGLTIPAVAYKVAVLGERPPLDQVSERRCPQALRLLVMACWDPDPLRRPAAAEAAKGLRSLLDSEGRRAPCRSSVTSVPGPEPVIPAPAAPSLLFPFDKVPQPHRKLQIAAAAGPSSEDPSAGDEAAGTTPTEELGRALRVHADTRDDSWTRLSEPPSLPTSRLPPPRKDPGSCAADSRASPPCDAATTWNGAISYVTAASAGEESSAAFLVRGLHGPHGPHALLAYSASGSGATAVGARAVAVAGADGADLERWREAGPILGNPLAPAPVGQGGARRIAEEPRPLSGLGVPAPFGAVAHGSGDVTRTTAEDTIHTRGWNSDWRAWSWRSRREGWVEGGLVHTGAECMWARATVG